MNARKWATRNANEKFQYASNAKLIKHFIGKRPAQVIQITNKCNLNNSTSKNMNLHMFDSETTTHKITFDYNAINISFRNIKLFFSFCLFVCKIKFDIVA